jgi:ribosome-associated translation inhibitor RaiA
MTTIQGIPKGSPLHRRVSEQFSGRLKRLGVRATTTRALFSDENGPKGGRAFRCILEVRLPRRDDLIVEEHAETARLAFDQALDALDRRLGREKETRRDRARRPKKYFVAKRLLAGGLDQG